MLYHKVTRPNKHFQVNGNFNAIRVNSRIVGWESQLQLFITITNVLRHKIEVQKTKNSKPGNAS